MTTVDEKIVNSKLDSNKVAEGDEAVPEPGLKKTEQGDTNESPTPEDKDKKLVTPAILPEFQYSKEQLMAIKEHPLSKKRPDCLLASFNNSRGVWDPERWHLNQKRSETPPDDNGKGDASDGHKRRSGDPRERIRKEQDGIVLSPQRRSFNTGCSMSQPSLSRRPDSPLGKGDRERDIIHREIATRRIGSGRISTRERDPWDFRLDRDKDADPSGDFNSFQRGTNSRDRDNDRYERRSYGRDYGDRIDRDKDRHRNNRGYGGSDRNDRNDRMDRLDRMDSRDRIDRNDRMDRGDRNDRRRGFSDSREEEPEWFSAGPTSQHDTIELRGFEDIPEDQPAKQTTKKQPPSSKTNTKISSRTSISVKPSPAATTNSSDNKSSPPLTVLDIVADVPSAPSPVDRLHSEPNTQNEKKSPTPERVSPKQETRQVNVPNESDSDFNFLDAFLKSDMLPELLTNGVDVGGPANSRFSQYFVVDSPEHQPDSRRNSLQDELLNNIMHDISEQTISIPSIGDSEAYFAPISPAASTAAIGSSAPAPPRMDVKPNSLLEMLQRSQGDGTKVPSLKDLAKKGKIQSVEELEARMMLQNKSNNITASNSSVPKRSEEDVAAFQKLLAQVINSKEVPSTSANGQRPTTQTHNDQINFLRILKGGGDGSAHQHTVRASPHPEQPINIFGSSGSHAGGSNMSRGLHHHHPLNSSQQNMHVPPDLVMKLLEVQRAGEMHRAREFKRQQQCQKELFDKLVAAQAQPQVNTGSSRSVPSFRHSVSPLPPDIQQMVNNGPPSQELLQRPEAQCIIQGLNRGELTSQHVVSQLQNPATQPRQREILANILKAQAQSGISPRANSPHMAMGSQPTDMLQHMMQQQQSQQHIQQQLRIPSPHNNAFCAPPPVISPNLTSNPNTLSVQHPGLPRIPSPHELVVHTQNIMQSALIKKKLEEQRENFRKRQEMQQSVSPNNLAMGTNTGSSRVGDTPQQKLVSSPTPLAFTPTSVLRKMTAEKDPEPMGVSTRNEIKQPLFSQPHNRSQGVTMQQQPQQQQRLQPQPQQSGTWNAPLAKQPAGRPIVKGSANFQTYTSTDYQTSQSSMQTPLYSQVTPGGSGGYSSSASRSKMPMTNPQPTNYPPAARPVVNVMMYARPPLNQINYAREQKKAAAAAFSQIHQNQQQLQHLPTHQQQSIRNLAQNPAFQNLTRHSFQQLLHGQSFGNTNRSSSSDGGVRQQTQPMPVRQTQSVNMHGGNELSVSPTSNQLAQWFSPELLAQAKAGRLAGMPPISAMQNILSLEELERLQQSSAAVHN